MKKIVLTGATGFVGSHIAEGLMDQGLVPSLVVRRRTNFIAHMEKKGAQVFVFSPDNDKSLKRALADADTVIHCAGATKAIDEKGYISANFHLTRQILQMIHEGQEFVFISSQAAAGPSPKGIPLEEDSPPSPVSAYGKSKLMAEESIKRWAETTGGTYTILRPSVVYGPRERDVYCMFRLIKMGVLPLVNGGRLRLSIVHVHDLVDAILRAVNKPSDNQTYFVAGDGEYTWSEVCMTIQRALNREKVLRVNISLAAMSPFALVCDTLSRITKKPALLNREKLLEMGQDAWLCSNSKIKTFLNWKPAISLEQGMRHTAEWYMRTGWL